MELLTKERAVEKLLQSYRNCYNIEMLENDAPFVAKCEYYATETGYILSSKAELWRAKSFEYLYILSVDELNEQTYRAIEQAVYERGMAQVHPKAGHMYTFITPVIVCDTATPDGIKALKKCRIHKSFKFSLYGWMDFHATAAVLSEEQTYSNMSGQSTAKHLKKVLFQTEKKKERKVV